MVQLGGFQKHDMCDMIIGFFDQREQMQKKFQHLKDFRRIEK
jgi:hypothetical protein